MKRFLFASIIAAGVITVIPFEETQAKTYRCTDKNGNLLITQRRSDCSNMKGGSISENRDPAAKRRDESAWKKARLVNKEAQQRRFDRIYSDIELQTN